MLVSALAISGIAPTGQTIAGRCRFPNQREPAMKRHTYVLALASLLCAVAGPPAYANSNGVYVQVTDNFYETTATETSVDLAGKTTITTSADNASYACDGNASFTDLPKGAGLKYCSQSATVKLVWKRVAQYPVISGDNIRSLLPGNSSTTYPASEHAVDDSDARHCETGQAVIWDVGASAVEALSAAMRDYCQDCAYTGGDCE